MQEAPAKRIKANVRTRTEAELILPPSAEVTRVVISHRIEGGKFVYDVTGPDGTTICHRPKLLTPVLPTA